MATRLYRLDVGLRERASFTLGNVDVTLAVTENPASELLEVDIADSNGAMIAAGASLTGDSDIFAPYRARGGLPSGQLVTLSEVDFSTATPTASDYGTKTGLFYLTSDAI